MINNITKTKVIEYFNQFTLSNLVFRKNNSSPSEWKTWIYSLNEYEINCVASTFHFDEVVQERYNHYRYSRMMLERYQAFKID